MRYLTCLRLINKKDRMNRNKIKAVGVYFRNYSSSDFQERRIKITTCGPLYRKWKEENLYSKLPSGDLIFEVKFIDSELHGFKNTARSPTILALHGAPGSWKDFSGLLSHLRQHGCRVIAPNFPDFIDYIPGIFRHSHLEKAYYVKDFLAAISVSHIDMLICHSAATYPGLNLCLDEKLVIKSLALLNPGTFNIKGMNATKHFWLLNLLVKAVENPLLFKFARNYGSFILKNIFKVRVRVENVLDPMLSATSMVYADIAQSEQKFRSVAKKMPIFCAFSENDPLIATKPSYELSEALGADAASDIFTYNKEGILVQKGKASSKLKVIAFQEGSHYVFFKHPKIIHSEVAEFLKSQLEESR